ncbi:CCA tRNA nucleotidyltransferase [Ornithinibacillus sp. 4-3]|uniref:CCA tRNA nucleotidyltransferase n=1 Tax=Ornithinibacillus sp. 4-3 TaxID=3231488 RepID=A0AB39HIL2_9BACI
MQTKAFLQANSILQRLEEHEHEAFFVGGCVRDFLLNRPIHDIDIVTSAFPEQIQNIFPQVIPVGIAHGTVIVRHEQKSYEVTTYKHYLNKQITANNKQKDIAEDLRLRDFTMNALAMNRSGEIIDIWGGRADIHQQLIRVVADEKGRFLEDPLRILRAVRFVSQLGFRIEKATLEYMNELRASLESVAIERVSSEWEKIITGAFFQRSLTYLKDSKVYQYLPIFNQYPEIFEEIPSNISKFDSFAAFITYMHFSNENIAVRRWLKAWNCSNKTKQQINIFIQAYNNLQQTGLNPWLVYQLPEAMDASFVRLAHQLIPTYEITQEQMQQLRSQLPIASARELEVNGREIMTLFPNLSRGPWIKELLQRIEYEVVFSRLPNKNNKIKEWILCNPPEQN